MKKLFLRIRLEAAASIAIAAGLFVSCQSSDFRVEKPTLSVNSVIIKNLDMEGITFNCAYSITNPYPAELSIKSLNANVSTSQGTFTKITANEGARVRAMGTERNNVSFKVPYETIIGYAKNSAASAYIPFKIEGAAGLDVSSVPVISAVSSTVNLPFSVGFDVPVFKPSFSISNPSVTLPDSQTILNVLLKSGMNTGTAANMLSSITSGNGIDTSLLKKVNLDIKINFNLNVKNEGGAPWKFTVNTCNMTSANGTVASITPSGTNTISSSEGSVPMTAKLNTMNSVDLIEQFINKSITNPDFNLSSSLSFPELSNAVNLPLTYTCKIPAASLISK